MKTMMKQLSTVVLGLLAFQFLVSASAAPPKTGGGTGKILFSSDYYKSMNPDGSQAAVFSNRLSYDPWVAVSSKQYSGKRWILVFEDVGTTQWCDPNGSNVRGTAYLRELFAYRSDGVRMQLTDLSQWGLNNDANWSNDVSVVWSNDNQDTFFSIRVAGGTMVNGNLVADNMNTPRYIARIGLTGAALNDIAARNTDADPTNDWPLIGEQADPRDLPDLLCTLNSTGAPSYSSAHTHMHGWSPDGTQLLYTQEDAAGTVNLYRNDLANVTVNLVMQDLQGGYMNVDWSPDGSKIAVGDYNDIFLVNPDGAGLQTLRKANWTKGTFYNAPYWSPDGKYLAYTLRKSSGDYIAKYTLSTGTEAQLTSGRFTLGWSAE